MGEKNPNQNDPVNDNDSMLTSSKDSDFLGFCGNVAHDKMGIEFKTFVTDDVTDVALLKQAAAAAAAAASSSDDSLEQSAVSEEFSDQDVRFKIEMEKRTDLFPTYATDVAEDDNSECTIEPTSSNDEVKQTEEPIQTIEITTNLHTLSVNENSSNAIDNPISSITYAVQPELIRDLSFNGKLNNEPKIIETIDEPVKQINAPPMENALITSDRNNLEAQLQFETSREQMNERSPDLFSDDEDDDENLEHSTSFTSISFEDKDNQTDDCIEKIDRKLSKQIQGLLSGILPPPSITYIQHDIGSLLSMYKQNIAIMNIDDKHTVDINDNHSDDWMPKELENIEYPHIQRVNAHGLHYNRTKYTDNIEIMYMKLVERNVGQETGSSFTYNASMSAKKKPIRKL